MRILIIQSRGHHPKNRKYRESLCLKRALNRIDGITAHVWGKGFNNYSVHFDRLVPMFDAFVLLENYSKRPWLPDLSLVKKLKLFWSIDAHIVLKRHLQIVNRNKINIVLNSTDFFVKHFSKNGKRSYWFPNCYPKDLIKPLKIKKIHDIGFCGNYVNRRKWINDLSRHFKLKRDIFVIGDRMVEAINSYKLHFNRNYSKDINYRTFETLGCRTLLLTNETDRLRDLLTPGKHCVVYNSFEDCRKKIRHLLMNPEARIQIEKAGYNKVVKEHTYDNRASLLLKIIRENI